jgi:hypothetical protein
MKSLRVVSTLTIIVGTDAFAPPAQFACQTLQLPSPDFASRESFTAPKVYNTAARQTLLARRPILSEDDLAAPPDKKIIEAVEKIGRNDVLASGK